MGDTGGTRCPLLGSVDMKDTSGSLDRPSFITGDIFRRSPRGTTLHAWEPWDFTRSILFEFQNSDIDEEHWEWKVSWFAGVALLRTIGHVLKNVDSRSSTKHAETINGFWHRWKTDRRAHWIFADFIERERNNILKEFAFGAALPALDDRRLLAYSNTDDDAAQLFREAVYWWRYQLELIEAEIPAE